jgi:hypothetical protein
MTFTKTPLNGTKHHPLTKSAIETLHSVHRRPIPRQEINAGQASRLEAEGLIEIVELPSPYKTVKGKVRHSQITDAGRALLRERGLIK